MTVTVELAGTLNIRPLDGSATPAGTTGCGHGFENRTDTRSAEAENGSSSASVASPSSFDALPIDSDMRGRLLHIYLDPNAAPVDVQLTLLASGVVTVPQVQGVFTLEKPAADAITGVAVQGTAKFAWRLTGGRS